jgi:hypothetical protein
VGARLDAAQRRLLERELRHVVVDTSTTTESASRDGGVGESELFVLRQGHSPGSSVPAGTEIRLFTTSDSTQAATQREAPADSAGAAPDSTESG